MEEQNLEQKLVEAENVLPGVKKQLESGRFGIFDVQGSYGVQDVKIAETEKYNFVAAKWQQHSWSDRGRSGIEWAGYLTLHYRKKGNDDGEIKEAITESIMIRHGSTHLGDRKELWPYTYVRILEIKPQEVEIAWANKDGKEGPAYKIKLED